MRLLSRVLVFSILITSITSLNSPSASAATVVSFEDLSSCPDEYLDKIPVGKQIQKCIFIGTELLFVNKFPKSKASTNIKIYFETTMIKETSAENLSLAFDKPGQYNFVIDAIDQSVKNENLLSEIFYVLEPPAMSSNSEMAGATSISEQKQSYLLTYLDSSIIQILEKNYASKYNNFLTQVGAVDFTTLNPNSFYYNMSMEHFTIGQTKVCLELNLFVTFFLIVNR